MNIILRTKKGFTLVEIMIVVVIIGLLAAMAIPAFQKVRASSQNKAIVNNIRQITAAAEQYFLEAGVTTVAVEDLIGNDAYIKGAGLESLQLATEVYPANITQGVDYVVTSVSLGSGGTGPDDHRPSPISTTITVSF